MWSQIFGWFRDSNWLLVGVGVAIEVLQIWMLVEAALMWNKAKGILPQPLPPLPSPAERGVSE
jgi:carbon starvation protein